MSLDKPRFLIEKIPDGPLDIIGDIHGEFDSLANLLRHLGYDKQGNHKANRKLIFVGDYCDRGPNSPAVLQLIEYLVASEKALAILGNHEINILRSEVKLGSGWFFESQYFCDETVFGVTNRVSSTQKKATLSFLNTLPIGLERQDIKIIHAAWIDKLVDHFRYVPIKDFLKTYEDLDVNAKSLAKHLEYSALNEVKSLKNGLGNINHMPPFLPSHAKYISIKQMANALKVLTNGVERPGTVPFFSNGHWRFIDRVRWWDEYDGDVPVVVGHYWRKLFSRPVSTSNGDPDMFDLNSGLDWHGKNKNVFCVDYSIGGKSYANKKNLDQENLNLAALRWPERILILDDGRSFETTNFKINR